MCACYKKKDQRSEFSADKQHPDYRIAPPEKIESEHQKQAILGRT